MKNKFIAKKNNKRKKIKNFFLFAMFIIGITISYKMLEKSKYKITDKDFTNLIINTTFSEDQYIIEKVANEVIKLSNPVRLLNKEYNKNLETIKTMTVEDQNKPIVYLYNTHQTEEYKPSDFIEFSINPTVIMNNYILEDIFNKNGYNTIVEESSIKEILKENNWNYANSYKATRILLEKRILENPTLKYFIDIHRDSLSRDKTTITIDNKDYAKILFIVGLENNNYQKNLNFTTRINNKLDEKYPGLSKGIYKKSGPGVNGVYNQDFSPYTILIEIGGYENTTTEVLNTTIAFSKCFLEVINEENN